MRSRQRSRARPSGYGGPNWSSKAGSPGRPESCSGDYSYSLDQIDETLIHRKHGEVLPQPGKFTGVASAKSHSRWLQEDFSEPIFRFAVVAVLVCRSRTKNLKGFHHGPRPGINCCWAARSRHQQFKIEVVPWPPRRDRKSVV